MQGDLRESVLPYLNTGTLFLCLFLVLVAFIFQGIDVTDFGFHCTNQISSVTFPIRFESVYPMVYFTDLVGGMWLSIPGSPNVIWARLGGVLFISLTGVLAFSLLCTYFRREYVFGIVLVCTIFLTHHMQSYLIQYYVFPAFLVTLGFYLVNHWMNSNGQKSAELYAFLSGFCAVAIVASRVPLIVDIVVPLLVLGYLLMVKEDLRGWYRSLGFLFLGVLASAVVFCALYYVLGLFSGCLAYFPAVFSNAVMGTSLPVGGIITSGHSVSTLSSIYAADIGAVLPDLIFPAAFAGIMYLLLVLRQQGRAPLLVTSLLYTVPVISAALVVRFVASGADPAVTSDRIIGDTAGILLIVSLYFVWYYTARDRKIAVLLIAGCTAMVLNIAGSNTGLYRLIDGMWVVLPLCILCCCSRTEELMPLIKKPVQFTLAVAVLAMLLVGLVFHATYLYRDDPDRAHLNTSFAYPALSGVYSTPDRVRALDDVLFRIRNNSRSGDEVLIVNSVPLLYYLTETRPALGNPWLSSEDTADMQRAQEALEEEHRYPVLFVYSRTNPRDPLWPDTRSIARDTDIEKLEYLKGRYITDLHYTLVWESPAFAIYKRPGVPGSGQ